MTRTGWGIRNYKTIKPTKKTKKKDFSIMPFYENINLLTYKIRHDRHNIGSIFFRKSILIGWSKLACEEITAFSKLKSLRN